MKLHRLLLVAALLSPLGQTFAGDSPALAAALDAVRENRYMADIYFVASDELKGRDTPSPELRIAALYIQARVERLGFTPGAQDGWFQDYPLYSSNVDAGNSYLRASVDGQTTQFDFGEDYYFLLASHAADLQATGELLCVDNASKKSLAEIGRQELSLEGKWALLLDSGKVVRRSIKRCLDMGAIGVLVTPGPSYKKDEGYPERYQRRADSLLKPSKPNIRERKAGQDARPVVMLDAAAAQRLFALSSAALTDGFPTLGSVLGVQLEEQRRMAEHQEMVSNVCAFWPGSDPKLAPQTMIVSAHYDHVGTRNGEIYNGADDNASGTCGLLALADALVAYGPMQRSVLLLWVSGEEKGLWGSETWAKSPWLPNDAQPVLDLNIDMIGRTKDDELYVTPSIDHDAFNSVAQVAYDLCELEGFGTLESQDEYWARSDHMNFYKYLQIPVAFLSSGDHPDYHKPTDTADKIKGAKATRIVRLIFRMLDQLQSADLGA